MKHYIAVTIMGVCALAVAVLLGGIEQHRYDRLAASNAKLKTYCTTVSVALDMDADELTNSTPKRQEAAAMRFGEQITYHSEQEIALCAKTHVDLGTRGECQLTHDYACLAKLARDAAAQVRP